MIYAQSTHPVEIKIIPLKVWALRDHLEALIGDYLDRQGTIAEVTAQEIKALYKRYNAESAVLEVLANKDAAAAEEKEKEKEEEEMKTQLSGIQEPDADASDDMEEMMKAALAEGGAGGETDQSKEKDEEDTQNLKAEKPESMDQAIVEPETHEEEFGANIDSNEWEKEEERPEDVAFILRPEIPEDKISHGSTLLADINMRGINFFTKDPFLMGQTVMIEFVIPKHFILSAEIQSCVNYNLSSRIISQKRAKYRAYADFSFLRRGERTLLREFVASIVPNIPTPAHRGGKKAKDEEISEDDFDDLGL